VNHAEVCERDLVALALGELTESKTRVLSAHVENCSVCTAELSDLASMLAAVHTTEPSLNNKDLLPNVLAKLSREQSVKPRFVLRRAWPVAVGALALAAGLFIALSPSVKNEAQDTGFTARSAGTAAEAWVGIDVFRLDERAQVSRLGDRMSADDALLFTYTNRGSEPFSHLMIFGVDVNGGVHWYYPAYVAPGTDPVAIPIARGVASVELPDQIRHSLPHGRLVLYGLFLRFAERVSTIEALITELVAKEAFAGSVLPRLPLPDSAEHLTAIEVDGKEP